ncbi:MAG: sulfotransferase domain-containing protein [Chloroflexota bacterium]
MSWVTHELRGAVTDLKRRFAPNRPACGISNWRQFARRVRSGDCRLLARLPDYPSAILVTGCQRSGTTMLARLVTSSAGMTNYWSGLDDELDAALILAGLEEPAATGRYCFQTTYLNECYQEYLEAPASVRILWVLRDPASVVNSMLHNWRPSALRELAAACRRQPPPKARNLPDLPVVRAQGRLGQACLAYIGKTAQLWMLAECLPRPMLAVIDYDELIRDKGRLLPEIYRFIGLPFRPEYGAAIRPPSARRALILDADARQLVGESCLPLYQAARRLATWPTPGAALEI